MTRRMPIYVYETIPDNADQEPQRFEVRQGMMEATLVVHRESGLPVRRIVSGGLGYMRTGGASPAAPAAAPG
ncbi:MAG: putative nucleic acid-binding Zn ribbon protein [Verrucomicrobiales bacterium]|jgi:predicted nucleic acid-binding Zn ribbon protein